MKRLHYHKGGFQWKIIAFFKRARNLKWSLQLNDTFLKYNETPRQLANDVKLTEQVTKIFIDQAPYPFSSDNEPKLVYDLKNKKVIIHFLEYK